MMNGGDIKKAVINKGKQMASVASAAANGNGGKKRRKGTDLKPIVTNENTTMADTNDMNSTSNQAYVLLFLIIPAPISTKYF
jgi:serine/threonine-protein kinase SRPK3